MNNTVKFIIAVAIPLLVGVTAGFFTMDGVNGWYALASKPYFNPPDWVFGPVWTILYVLMGIAFFLIWKQNDTSIKKKAVIIYFVQLTLNFCWSIIFFYARQPGWAFLEIICLWLLILATIFTFSNLSAVAAWLLVPYICWVSFAMLLNYEIWQLN